jgi:tRNA-guanine family transglycosylase
MVNAYDIIPRRWRLEMAAGNGLSSYLGFDGPIMVDSGGFLYLRSPRHPYSATQLLSFYEQVGVDIGVALDCPSPPTLSTAARARRWEQTFQNLRLMHENNGHVGLMPVLHGVSLREIDRAADDVKGLYDPTMIGIGSLVPILRCSKGSAEGLRTVFDIVRRVRERFPKTFIHAFGVGSVLMARTFWLLGVDSLDSNSWKLKAAYGHILLPGLGERRPLGVDPKHPRLSTGERALLAKCRCPVCRELGPRKRLKILDASFKSRAIHNAWVVQQDALQFRRDLQKRQAWNLTLELLDKSHRYRPYIEALEGG